MEQGGEPVHEGRTFTEYGGEIAKFGVPLLDVLCTERAVEYPEWDYNKPEWQEVDVRALDLWFQFEDVLRQVPLSTGLGETLATGVIHNEQPRYERVHLFHTALPFSEAERAWLLSLRDDLDIDKAQPIHERFNDKEDCILAAGLMRYMSGRNLMRQWLSWRREADEYEGQYSLEIARSALYDTIKRLSPDTPVPDSYFAWLRRQKAH